MTFFSRSRGLRGGSAHRSKMRFPQPSKAAISSPYGLFHAAPADSVELAAECSSVCNGRFGNDSADLTFLYTHSAVISSPRICQRADLFASWSQPRAPDIGISAIAILLETGTWELVPLVGFEPTFRHKFVTLFSIKTQRLFFTIDNHCGISK